MAITTNEMDRLRADLERLRADAAEFTARRAERGRAAGRAWALEAGAAQLKRLADAAARFRTAGGYVGACADSPLGLAGRLYADIHGPQGGEFLDGDEVEAFWHDAFWGEGEAARDRDVAAAFVTAALGVWDEAQAA
jgi:hypothetical protein